MNNKTTRWLIVGLVLAASWSARQAVAQDPAEFLRRLDTNNDGMIDASELEGRFGGFILRMADNNPRLDFSRPVPIDRVAAEFTRMREERMQAGGGGPGGGTGGGPGGWGGGRGEDTQGRGGPPGGRPTGGDDAGRDRGRGGGDERTNVYRAPEANEMKPLVPVFGEEEVISPPLGFGAEGELFSVVITEQDRQEAARAFRYYDRNNDGRIDQEEMQRSRRGADLMQYDRNRDGVITLDEMEYRYARRRIENTRTAAAGGQGERDQGQQGGERRGRGGRDGGREGGEGRGQSNGNPSPYAALNSYRVVAPVERLPAGLPDWFYRNDADGDGQISMAEFSATWTEAVLEDFYQFDLNRDGLITPEEALRAKAAGAVRGSAVSAAAPATESNEASSRSRGAPTDS
ncbi:MAG: hypothetical protein EA424_14850, partial [Planctomycetaceae bacterium]